MQVNNRQGCPVPSHRVCPVNAALVARAQVGLICFACADPGIKVVRELRRFEPERSVRPWAECEQGQYGDERSEKDQGAARHVIHNAPLH